jgi:hypothetical protein
MTKAIGMISVAIVFLFILTIVVFYPIMEVR